VVPFIEAQILSPALSGLSLTLDAVVAWFHGSTPRSWLSHAVVWFLVQSGGGLVDAVIRSGRPPRRFFRLIAFGGAFLFYGVRETLDTGRGIVTMDWVLIGDSVMDFLVPAVLNTFLLSWLIRRDARGLAAEFEARARGGGSPGRREVDLGAPACDLAGRPGAAVRAGSPEEPGGRAAGSAPRAADRRTKPRPESRLRPGPRCAGERRSIGLVPPRETAGSRLFPSS